MQITLGPDLERALTRLAGLQGMASEDLALKVLRERFLPKTWQRVPHEELMRRSRAMGKDRGVSLPNSALGRDEMYD